MNKPTASEYRSAPNIDWVALGFPTGGSPDPITAEINLAWSYVEEKTGRDLDTLDATSNLGILGARAVLLRTIQQAYQWSTSFISSSTTAGTGIKSFAVPDYTETRFGPGDTTISKTKLGALVNEWPQLADLLWLLMTPEAQENFIFAQTGEFPPAMSIQATDWELTKVYDLFQLPYRRHE